MVGMKYCKRLCGGDWKGEKYVKIIDGQNHRTGSEPHVLSVIT
jgi:hypothetical protein